MTLHNESLFLISSAITTRYGVYHRSTRIKQTKETISSVRNHCPRADIVIIDGGQRDLEDHEKKSLFNDVIEFRSFASDDTVKQIQKVDNHDIVKNMIEIYMFKTYYEYMLSKDWHKKYKRIFKLSGRYTLNDNFDYDRHLSCSNGIALLYSKRSQFPPQVTGNAALQYMSRMWSFDASLLEYVTNTYTNMFNDMKSRIESGGYIDIEHLLYKHLDDKLITKFDVMGVSGNIAPNGMEVSE